MLAGVLETSGEASTMAKFGYKLMAETTGPKDLVRNASGLSPPSRLCLRIGRARTAPAVGQGQCGTNR